jgi:outer membrane lipoprotein-sorting protein
VCIACAAAPAAADEPKPETLTAEQLLEGMAKVYANCKTYKDTGIVTIDLILPQGKRTQTRPFETAFVRPDRFRFEFSDGAPKSNRFLIWSKGKEVQTWWYAQPGIKKPESLRIAVAQATGVSGGSANTIPLLLMPGEIPGTSLSSLTDVKRIADAKHNDADCFRVEGKLVNTPRTVWLDKKKFLVLRIDWQSTNAKGRSETTTTYEPVIDGQIDEKLLAFDPPK